MAVFTIPVKSTVTLSTDELPANGLASASIIVENFALSGNRSLFSWHEPRLIVEHGSDLIRLGPLVRRDGHWRQDIIVGIRPGSLALRLDRGGEDDFRASIAIVPDADDWDEDGLPNAVELVSEEDRLAFRTWFVAVAKSLVVKPAPDWYLVHRDCAGLLRYSYKEALRRHDRSWWSAPRSLRPPISRDVARYNYPKVPIVGERLFQTGDADPRFSASATARVLRDHNTVYLAHEADAAVNGDLLFFERRGESGHVMHAMIFVEGNSKGSKQERDPLLVYHTGPEGFGNVVPDGSGEVRLVRLHDLNQHPDLTWHATRDNPNFSGYFRWRILD